MTKIPCLSIALAALMLGTFLRPAWAQSPAPTLVLQAAAIKKACESAAYPASQPWVAEARIAITTGNPVAGRTAGCGALLTFGVVCGVSADAAAGLPPPSPLAIELARAVTRTVMTAHGLIPCD